MAVIDTQNSFQVFRKQFSFSTVEYQDYRLSVSFYRLSHYVTFSSEVERFINKNLLAYLEGICSKSLQHKTTHGSMFSPKCACYFLKVHDKHLVKNKQEERKTPSPNKKETCELSNNKQ